MNRKIRKPSQWPGWGDQRNSRKAHYWSSSQEAEWDSPDTTVPDFWRRHEYRAVQYPNGWDPVVQSLWQRRAERGGELRWKGLSPGRNI